MEALPSDEYPIPFLNPDGSCDYRIIVAGKNLFDLQGGTFFHKPERGWLRAVIADQP